MRRGRLRKCEMYGRRKDGKVNNIMGGTNRVYGKSTKEIMACQFWIEVTSYRYLNK